MLANYLYSISTKSKVHEYWLDEALKTIDMADKYLKEIKPTASTIVGHEIEIDFRKSQIMAVKGLNKDASDHYKNLLKKQKDPHQKARILHNLVNLSENDEEKKCFSFELISILEQI